MLFGLKTVSVKTIICLFTCIGKSPLPTRAYGMCEDITCPGSIVMLLEKRYQQNPEADFPLFKLQVVGLRRLVCLEGGRFVVFGRGVPTDSLSETGPQTRSEAFIRHVFQPWRKLLTARSWYDSSMSHLSGFLNPFLWGVNFV